MLLTQCCVKTKHPLNTTTARNSSFSNAMQCFCKPELQEEPSARTCCLLPLARLVVSLQTATHAVGGSGGVMPRSGVISLAGSLAGLTGWHFSLSAYMVSEYVHCTCRGGASRSIPQDPQPSSILVDIDVVVVLVVVMGISVRASSGPPAPARDPSPRMDPCLLLLALAVVFVSIPPRLLALSPCSHARSQTHCLSGSAELQKVEPGLSSCCCGVMELRRHFRGADRWTEELSRQLPQPTTTTKRHGNQA